MSAAILGENELGDFALGGDEPAVSFVAPLIRLPTSAWVSLTGGAVAITPHATTVEVTSD